MLVNELHQGGIRALFDYDNTIFDNMVLPDDIDSDSVIDHILYKYGDAPLFSPDPDVIKYYIGRWSNRRLSLWNRYKAAIDTEYEPLENYDRSEYSTFTHGKQTAHTGTITDAPSGTIIDTPSGTITDSQDLSKEQLRAADNSSTYEAYDKEVDSGTTNERTYTDYQETRSYSNYQEQRTYNNTDTDSGDDITESRIHGNIGVTTSQQMLNSELDLIPRLDLIDYIADDWHSEFNLMLYV